MDGRKENMGYMYIAKLSWGFGFVDHRSKIIGNERMQKQIKRLLTRLWSFKYAQDTPWFQSHSLKKLFNLEDWVDGRA